MPAPTVAEVLKQSGWSQEKIDALDAQALSGITTYVSTVYQTAEQKEKAASELAVKAEADRNAQEAAAAAAKTTLEAVELQKRSVDEFWNNTFNPGIAAWEAEKIKLAKMASDASAEAAFYKAQTASLKDSGIVPADAPVFTPAAIIPPVESKTPGTPTFSQDEFLKRVDKGVYSIQDIGWKYQQIYGTPIPISPSELVAKSDALKLSPMEYAARTYKFAEKEEEHRQELSRKHDEGIASAEREKNESEWKAKLDAQSSEFAAKERKMAEQISAHPDMHLPLGQAKFTEVRRAQQAGERPDPTRMTPEARLKLTQENVRKNFEERQQQVA